MRAVGAVFIALGMGGLGASGLAQAADLGRPAPVYTKAPFMIMDPWSGFYLGDHIGGAWDREEGTTVTASPLLAAGTRTSGDGSSFLGGGQFGFNHLMGNLLIGAEGDFSWVEAKTSSTLIPPGFPTLTASGSSKADWYATATARFGVTTGPALFYVKGGAAWEDISYSAGLSGTAPPLVLPVSATNGSSVRSGWTVGGGIEYAFAPRWSAKVEYDFMDFGTDRQTFTFAGIPGGPGGTDLRSQVHVVKAGVNYHLDWWGR